MPKDTATVTTCIGCWGMGFQRAALDDTAAGQFHACKVCGGSGEFHANAKPGVAQRPVDEMPGFT